MIVHYSLFWRVINDKNIHRVNDIHSGNTAVKIPSDAAVSMRRMQLVPRVWARVINFLSQR